MSETFNGRTATYPIDPLFLHRWSPRALSGEKISESHLLTILEAARWAPSSFNSQPWRFLYARRGTQYWDTFLGLLNEFNQSWVRNASAIVIAVSKTTFTPPGASEERPSYSHSFDTGAAWANLALQAVRLGWHAHAMIGFDVEGARQALNVPENFRIEAAIAIGRITDKTVLPERLQARETPSQRLALSQIVCEGAFPQR